MLLKGIIMCWPHPVNVYCAFKRTGATEDVNSSQLANTSCSCVIIHSKMNTEVLGKLWGKLQNFILLLSKSCSRGISKLNIFSQFYVNSKNVFADRPG